MIFKKTNITKAQTDNIVAFVNLKSISFRTDIKILVTISRIFMRWKIENLPSFGASANQLYVCELTAILH